MVVYAFLAAGSPSRRADRLRAQAFFAVNVVLKLLRTLPSHWGKYY